MDVDYIIEVFDDFDPDNFADHAAELGPHYTRRLRHGGRTADGYSGPNYRQIVLLAAERAATLLGRPLTITDHPRDARTGSGSIVMSITDWTEDDVCVCADEWRIRMELFGEVRPSDMEGVVCRPRREAHGR